MAVGGMGSKAVRTEAGMGVGSGQEGTEADMEKADRTVAVATVAEVTVAAATVAAATAAADTVAEVTVVVVMVVVATAEEVSLQHLPLHECQPRGFLFLTRRKRFGPRAAAS